MFHRQFTFLVLAATLSCGASTQSIVQCKLAAVEKLPEDPLAVNAVDLANLIARLQNCHQPAPGDAGAP